MIAGLRSGVFFWVGSEVDFGQFNPIIPGKYSDNVPLATRIDTVIKWLLEDQLDLVMSYWHKPDKPGHNFGPFTKEVEESLKVLRNK